MLIDEMRLYTEADDSDRAEDIQEEKGSKQKDFYEFDSDEESTTCDTVEMEAARYLSDAKPLGHLHKYPTIRKLFPVEQLFSLGIWC